MKKLLALALMAVMVITLFAGCSDPLYDDFENFLNVEMEDVNANYENIKAEVNKWEEATDEAALTTSLKDVLLPLVNDSLAKLDAIAPATEEVNALKAKYVEVMEAYKAGFEGFLEGIETQNPDKVTEGEASISAGIALLDEYNAALEALATEVGGEISY